MEKEAEVIRGFKIEKCQRCGFLVMAHDTPEECIRILKLKVERLEKWIKLKEPDRDGR